MTPHVTWITPTYGRPVQLANLRSCFDSQNYPKSHMHHLILDDASQYGHSDSGCTTRGMTTVVSLKQRFASLPEKFNACVALSVPETEIFIIAEDDDSYLADHTRLHVQAMVDGNGNWSKPSLVFSDYPGTLVTEESAGRFHGSIAFSRETHQRVGGWVLTESETFDQQFMERLTRVGGALVDPISLGHPTYCFRWHTAAYHGQDKMGGIKGENAWYNDCKQLGQRQARSIPAPCMDSFTRELYQRK